VSSTADLTHDGYEPWSPDMVRQQTFPQPTRRAPAVDKREVEKFTTRMGDEIEWLHERIRGLEAQLQLARGAVDLATTGELSVYETVDEQSIQIRIAAQVEADRIIAEAIEQGDAVMADASDQAEQIINAAHERDALILSPTGSVTVTRAVELDLSLPDRITRWEEEGASISLEVERRAAEVQDARTRLTAASQQIHKGLASGELRSQPELPHDNPG
jgi:cell division septum initiation protein DivIVA